MSELQNWLLAFVTEIYFMVIYAPFGTLYGHRKVFQYYGLNPFHITKEDAKKPAILFLHGQMHNQSGALSLARNLEKAAIGTFFTINLKYDEEHPHAHEQKLRERIVEIQGLYEKQGVKELPLIIIGHSRGGIEALNCLYGYKLPENVKILLIITIASRLCLGDQLIRWRACPAPLINLVKKISKQARNYRERLYHIVSDKDWRVSLQASLLNLDLKHYHVVKNRSHLGILFSAEAHRKVIEFIRHCTLSQVYEDVDKGA